MKDSIVARTARAPRTRTALALSLSAVVSLLLLGGCSDDSQAESPPAPPPPLVETLVVEPRAVPNRIELLGRVEPFRVSEVRARTDGLVEEVVYEEGSDVEAGDVLFRIDPRVVQASVDEAEARLRSARVAADNAQKAADRAEELIGQNVISRQEYDDAREGLQSANAAVAQTEAALQSSRISLGYAEVKAPIKGRAGRAQVREGSLVSASQATLLVTLRRTDQVYVNLAESATDLLAVRARIRAGDIDLPDADDVAVELLDDEGKPRGITGRIDFLDQTVDEETGTVTLRAVLPNPDGLLLPGQLVDTAILAGELSAAMLVPQAAVQLGTGDAALMVVEDGKVRRQPVELGKMLGGEWLILSGLEPGDEIALDNLQKLADGAPVRLARLEGDGGGGTGGPADGEGGDRGGAGADEGAGAEADDPGDTAGTAEEGGGEDADARSAPATER